LGLLALAAGLANAGTADNSRGVFLVATERLEGTGFQGAVILLTHSNPRGTTGLTINRPSGIPLRRVFPHTPQLRQQTSPLFMGGPVNTNAIFALVRTSQPRRGMHHIADNIYFATGQIAFGGALEGRLRAYAGYAGWAPGQLQQEIANGDWLVVHTDPAIVFDKNTAGLWQRLTYRWSGRWL
jgi:putative transcriptional regulator